METDAHFARLLADLPEALARDEAFLGELDFPVGNQTQYFTQGGFRRFAEYDVSCMDD